MLIFGRDPSSTPLHPRTMQHTPYTPHYPLTCPHTAPYTALCCSLIHISSYPHSYQHGRYSAHAAERDTDVFHGTLHSEHDAPASCTSLLLLRSSLLSRPASSWLLLSGPGERVVRVYACLKARLILGPQIQKSLSKESKTPQNPFARSLAQSRLHSCYSRSDTSLRSPRSLARLFCRVNRYAFWYLLRSLSALQAACAKRDSLLRVVNSSPC
ncbi:hypothetical protein FKP32DRAFT_510362 [Trametes sanguinea]|nr:hypothetical protein FKP32DRAFT_510362 [Trametes sanguinea]